jgi:hypothetical protein
VICQQCGEPIFGSISSHVCKKKGQTPMASLYEAYSRRVVRLQCSPVGIIAAVVIMAAIAVHWVAVEADRVLPTILHIMLLGSLSIVALMAVNAVIRAAVRRYQQDRVRQYQQSRTAAPVVTPVPVPVAELEPESVELVQGDDYVYVLGVNGVERVSRSQIDELA